MKNFIFNNFIASKIAAMFSGLKGYKTQIGIATCIALQAAKYFAPIPVAYLPFLDKVMDIVIGATGISLGDKVRRNYEIAKSATDELMNKVVTGPADVVPPGPQI